MSEREQQREVRSLDQRTARVAEKIASHIEARLKGGPNLKADDLALIDGLRDELSSEEIAGWKQQTAGFADAKQSEPVNPEAMALATVDAQGGIGSTLKRRHCNRRNQRRTRQN